MKLLRTSCRYRAEKFSSARSAVFIANMRQWNLAPLGAAWRARAVGCRHMPLLTELEENPFGGCFYKHVAPNGAIAPVTVEANKRHPSPLNGESAGMSGDNGLARS